MLQIILHEILYSHFASKFFKFLIALYEELCAVRVCCVALQTALISDVLLCN